ncbi:MAG: hypothetical protein ACE5HQ_12980 [Gemmatimonadota bacterium]
MTGNPLVSTLAVGVGLALSVAAGCARPDLPRASASGASHLFVWAGDADQEDSDFLAVIDARRSAPTYGQVVATLSVGARGTVPHHTEYEYPSNDLLFANGWVAGRTFRIDLRNPLEPRLAGQFTSVEGYSFPHAFARLPNGHVLATFQARGDRYAPPGGLVELDAEGRGVRAASAATPEVDDALIWPYSLVVLPQLDRAVSTSAEMGMPPWDEWSYHDTYHVQVWSLDDLRLVATVPLPDVDQGAYHIGPAEPRALSDGTVYVSTFSCGLYRIDGLESARPEAAFVHAFPGGTSLETECGVPVVYGKYWIQTVPALPGLIVLDMSDPLEPVEVSRLRLEERYRRPHWVAADRASARLVVTGDGASWVLIVDLDQETGALTVDEAFRDTGAAHPGIDFHRMQWPHGATGGAVVHGALFGK